MKYYYIESNSRWFIVKARTKRIARKAGVAELGRGRIKNLRVATVAEVQSFIGQKGEEAIEHLEWE